MLNRVLNRVINTATSKKSVSVGFVISSSLLRCSFCDILYQGCAACHRHAYLSVHLSCDILVGTS